MSAGRFHSTRSYFLYVMNFISHVFVSLFSFYLDSLPLATTWIAESRCVEHEGKDEEQ